MKRKIRNVLIVFVVLIAIYAIFFRSSGPPMTWEHGMCRDEVNTYEGPVKGTGEDGPDVCAYKGIPYADSPVDELRWKPPVAAPKRSEVFEAYSFSAECPQRGMVPSYANIGYSSDRSEDCLAINIWKPKKKGIFPVMVWVHGGGLTDGSSSEPMYGGDRLSAQKDVIVVSFNYRLGPLGFLAHKELSKEDPNSSSGNYGLLDQIAALKWVQNNIAAFGGDRNNVTIFGESAGGWSVCNLMASPLAAGTFNKAIIQSGGCDTTRTMKQGFENGDKVAKMLGCDGKDDVLKCMRSKSADDVIDIIAERDHEVVSGFKHWEHVWSPHIDGWVLNETPIEALKSGNYNQVPLMVGSNRDENKLFATMSKMTYRWISDSKVKKKINGFLGDKLTSEFEKLYPYDKYPKVIDAYIDAKGDIGLGCSNFDAAQASALHQPTYYYRHDYDDHRMPNLIGAAHAIEIQYIFDGMDRPYFNMLFSKKQKMKATPLVKAMMGYWANFAKKGDPNGKGLMEWPKYNLKDQQRMYLDLPQKVDKTGNEKKCAFWKNNASENNKK